MSERVELPIAFSTEMVSAILAKRKWNTRRVAGLARINGNPDEWEVLREGGGFGDDGRLYYALWNRHDRVSKTVKCPYGVPGSVLWVREWYRYFCTRVYEGLQFKDGSVLNFSDLSFSANGKDWDKYNLIRASLCDDCGTGPWRTGMFLPRFGARIFLRVKSIRLERLGDISTEDAIAEGIESFTSGETYYRLSDWSDGLGNVDPVFVFEKLWDSINGKGDYAWSKNPWVWVVEFELVEVRT